MLRKLVGIPVLQGVGGCQWAKMNFAKHYDLQPHNSEQFWILLGFDQLLHHITYFMIVYFSFNLSLNF
jgi:hypothetical protein